MLFAFMIRKSNNFHNKNLLVRRRMRNLSYKGHYKYVKPRSKLYFIIDLKEMSVIIFKNPNLRLC